ncbi:CGNR zinc finger domain-containing protein [Terriglobus aquaticus]|uniref:CGNR zinc finger domain-containing protein n=1 Tax=Terriglobus aquaticus TaxID=940139 RepID=A0ABW9KK03_9BACT
MESTEKLNKSIERVLAFLNSRAVGFEKGIDQLRNAEEASRFLAPAFGQQAVISSRALGELRRLRQALLDLVATGWREGAAADALNEIASRSLYTIAFRGDQEIALQPVHEGAALSVLIRDVAGLIEAGQWNRVKHCSDGACSATFFDRSRNRTQRWHSFEICGNKNNVAAHRARHA